MKRYQLRLLVFTVFAASLTLGSSALYLAYEGQTQIFLATGLGALAALLAGLSALAIHLERLEDGRSRERDDLLGRLEVLADESFRTKETLEQVRRECEAVIGGPISMEKREKLARILLIIEESQGESAGPDHNSTSYAA